MNPLVTAINLKKVNFVEALFNRIGEKKADALRHKQGEDTTPLSMAMKVDGGSGDLVQMLIHEIKKKVEEDGYDSEFQMWRILQRFDQRTLVEYLAYMAMSSEADETHKKSFKDMKQYFPNTKLNEMLAERIVLREMRETSSIEKNDDPCVGARFVKTEKGMVRTTKGIPASNMHGVEFCITPFEDFDYFDFGDDEKQGRATFVRIESEKNIYMRYKDLYLPVPLLKIYLKKYITFLRCKVGIG